MAIHVLQGERELVQDCRSLSRFDLRGIPPMAAGAAKIRVTFQVDADGLLEVSARELTSGVAASVQVKPSYGLSDLQIADMIKASWTNVEDDRSARSLREQQVEADRLLEAVTMALQRNDGFTRCLIGQPNNMQTSSPLIGERELSKLKWRCRRGLLENDLFVERFFKRYEASLTVDQVNSWHTK